MPAPALPSVELTNMPASRDVLLSHVGAITVPIVVDAATAIDQAADPTSLVRAGWLLGRVTTTGRWCPCKRTTVTATTAPAGGATVVAVADVAAFRVGDSVTVDGVAAVISAVNAAAKTITVDEEITAGSGDAVAATDGSQTCRGVLLDTVRLVRDGSVEPADRPARLLIQGAVQAAFVLGDRAAIAADSAALLAGIRFSDDYGV